VHDSLCDTHGTLTLCPQKDEEKPKPAIKAAKVGRRLSARVGEFFKPKAKAETTTPAKVDEHPPKIDEPAPVAPLEHPATESKEAAPEAAASSPPAAEESKPAEAAPAVVEATA
jgi:hypothetical protein